MLGVVRGLRGDLGGRDGGNLRALRFEERDLRFHFFWGEMSAAKPAVAVRDLVEEAKKRVVFLAICVVGLSYLMSCK